MDCKRIVHDQLMNYDENDGKEPISTPDTENSTRINAAEADDTEKFKRLSGINTGATDTFGNHVDEVVTKQERAASFDIIADHANLPEHVQREGRNLMMDSVDTERLSRPGSTVHLMSFCLAVCLVNKRCDRRNYHPQSNEKDVYLDETREEFDFDVGLIHSYLQKLLNQVEEL